MIANTSFNIHDRARHAAMFIFEKLHGARSVRRRLHRETLPCLKKY
ncbi:MAG: hypothetical protein HY853_05890 [Burkholderiales bacterium]|nr:hypothetical protein [Burkholderiales bacterium]